AHVARLAVAHRAADHRISLVGGDDLQLARLATEHLRGSDLGEELAGHEMARASQADLLAERPEQPERAPRLAALEAPRRLGLAQRVQLHVGGAEAVKKAVALGERPGIA